MSGTREKLASRRQEEPPPEKRTRLKIEEEQDISELVLNL